MSRLHDKILITCIAAALTLGAAASADPPARVGRLNLVQEGVSFRPAEAEEWTAAALNYPLTAGDSLWTEEGSLAEAHVGSTALRLGPSSQMSVRELDDQRVRVDLPLGLLNVRLRELDSGESFQVDTPTVSVLLLVPGSYRIEVLDGGDTRATVSEGEIQVSCGGLYYPVRARQAAFARSAVLSLEIRTAPAADRWDRWCAERDRREDRLASLRYVPRAMTGCEDLDWYGSWSETTDYGPVWIPSSLPAGWAPYSFGHWVWVQPWGWTWVDNMPWGFAPFHYGRWALSRGHWVWVPGSIRYRPVYAPALVAFTGAGPGDAVRNGRTGWFPLGPGEAYVPPYSASRAYIQKVNVRHVQVGEHQAGDARPRAAPKPERELAPAARDWIGQLSRAIESGSKAASKREAARNTPQMKRDSKDIAAHNAQKRLKVMKKKRLPNGQWVWVEEWVAEK